MNWLGSKGASCEAMEDLKTWNIGVDLITWHCRWTTLISSIMIWHISTQIKAGAIDTVQILYPQFKQYKLRNDDKDGAPRSINESSAHMSEIAFCCCSKQSKASHSAFGRVVRAAALQLGEQQFEPPQCIMGVFLSQVNLSESSLFFYLSVRSRHPSNIWEG